MYIYDKHFSCIWSMMMVIKIIKSIKLSLWILVVYYTNDHAKLSQVWWERNRNKTEHEGAVKYGMG